MAYKHEKKPRTLRLKTAPIKESARGISDNLMRLGRLVKNSPNAIRFVSVLGLSNEDSAEVMKLLKE